MTIGEKIKFLRKNNGLTQEELAEYAGTKKQTIHKYETGIIENIPASKIKLIAEKLDTTPAYLMGWTDDGTSDSTEYKKEDATADIFLRLRTDSHFYEAVQKLYNLSPTKLQGVISMLSSFEQD